MIRGYIAMSADGFIADRDGEVDWLKPFETIDYGYADFYSGIDRVIMGRTTYDQIASFGGPWPYPGKRTLVVTSRALLPPYPGVTAWTLGLPALAQLLKDADSDSWIVGGAKLQASFIEARLLDRLELHVMPILLGSGLPLFPSDKDPVPMDLERSHIFANGIVKLDYRFNRVS